MTTLRERFFEFTLKTQQEARDPLSRVLLIDGHNNFIRNYMASSHTDNDGEHVGGAVGFLLSLGATLRILKPTRVVIAFDGPGGSQRRRAIYSEYKANRASNRLNRPFAPASLDEEQKSMRRQMATLMELLKTLPVTVMTIDNVEADDVIAYLAQLITERQGKSVIMSTDKDFLQLVDDNVSVWNPIKKQTYYPEKIVEQYGFHPHNFLLYRVVSGDESDNVPGVGGIQEKTLRKYFPELEQAEKRTIEFLLESAERQTKDVKKPPVVLQRLLQSRDVLDRNMKLMDLRNVQMSGQTKLSVIEKFDDKVPVFSKPTLTRTLMTAKILHLFPELELWTQECFLPLQRLAKT